MNVGGHEAAAHHVPGAKSGRAASVGHQAKAAVAAAREAGIDLPKNAQGFAASAIAHGAAPESVFVALVTLPPPPPDDGGGSTGGVPVNDVVVADDLVEVGAGDADATDASETAEEVAVAVAETVADGTDDPVDAEFAAGVTSAEIALETLVSEELDDVLGLG